MTRLGLLGGTFDPPHMGHLILAELAREQLGLDRVLWVPVGVQPLKQGQAITPVTHRLEMLRLALEFPPQTAFEISRVDVDRPGPHYTVDTLNLIAVAQPRAELTLLIGGDSLRDLPLWHDPSRLIARARLAVMQRPGASCDLAALEAAVPGLRESLIFLDIPCIDISSTAIRQRITEGQTIRYLVPEAVEAYIARHGLYKQASSG